MSLPQITRSLNRRRPLIPGKVLRLLIFASIFHAPFQRGRNAAQHVGRVTVIIRIFEREITDWVVPAFRASSACESLALVRSA